ncbi:MAG: dienelactone hydrolase family protein [Bacteroidia bacterium]
MEEKGYQEVKNSRTGQVFKLGLELLDDIEKNGKSRLNILKNVRELKKPLLVLHGQEDETIPFFEAEHINVYADVRQTTLRLIPNAGHTFGAKHPFEGSNPALDELLELTYEFFQEKF